MQAAEAAYERTKTMVAEELDKLPDADARAGYLSAVRGLTMVLDGGVEAERAPGWAGVRQEGGA